MEKGDIVLVPFPFTDLLGVKFRPALVLISGKNYVTLGFISTKLFWEEETDLTLEPTLENGLKKKSLVKLSKIATLDIHLIQGKIGSLSTDNIRELDKNLIQLFQLDSSTVQQ